MRLSSRSTGIAGEVKRPSQYEGAMLSRVPYLHEPRVFVKYLWQRSE